MFLIIRFVQSRHCRWKMKMRCAISIPGILCAVKSSLILSLAFSQRSIEANEMNAFNLCTQNHCEDCSSGEFFKCTNGAVSNRCGDLCGCCHSCVKFRDVGESCGSQLAVRSSDYFRNSMSNVTILATASCKKDLICKNFTCEKSHEKVNIDIAGKKQWENIENAKNESVRMRRMKLPLFIDNSSSINSTNEFLSTIGSYENENFSEDTKVNMENKEKISFDSSEHLINVIIASREFQFIFGYQALEDFYLLINSIEKNQTNSIFKEHEVTILLEHFKDVFEFVNSKRREFVKDKETNSSVMLKKQNSFSRVRGEKFSKIQSRARRFRKKRELDKIEEFRKVEMENRTNVNEKEFHDGIRKEYDGISVYDIVNKTPRQMEDFDRYLIARKIEKYPQENSSMVKASDSDEIGSEINIHITGVPKMTNISLEEIQTDVDNDEVEKINEKSDEIYINDENSEIFGSTENNDVTTILSTKNVTNYTTSEITENEKTSNHHNVSDTIENSTNDDEKTQLLQNHYEFTFPENPVTFETDYNRDIDIIINETVDDFKAQLNRIETRAIIIENAVFDMKRKIDVDRRYENIENQKKIVDNVEREVNGFTRDEIIPRKRKIVRFSNAASYAHPFSDDPQVRNFTIKDTRLEEFPLDRSSQHRRTVRTRPDGSEAPRISRHRRRRLNQSDENKIIESGFLTRGKFPRDPKYADERYRIPSPRGSSSMKFFKILPQALRQRKFPIFVSSTDSSRADFFNYQHSVPQLFSREQFTFDGNPDSSYERSLWPMNLVLDRAFPADRTSRKVEEEIRVRERHSKLGNPVVEEAIVLLETQIPRSINSGDSMINDQTIGDNSMRIIKKHEDEGSWNWREEKPSLNLFDVNDENSEFATTSSGSKIPETLILPIESLTVNVNRPEGQEEAENGYSMSSIYLNYPERSENKNNKDEDILKSETSESSLNPEKNEPISTTANRKKRDAIDISSRRQEFSKNVRNQRVQPAKTMDSKIHKLPSSTKNTNEKSIFLTNIEKRKDYEKLLDKVATDVKNQSIKRSRRSVQMVDWLRAAQEYHERLRQMRNAAIKTWLASQEILTDANLTNVKLFTSEIPPYLDKYKTSAFQDNFDGIIDEKSQDYTRKFHEHEDSIPDSSEVLTDIFAEYPSPRINESGQKSNENTDVRTREPSNLSGRRKFTIITNGNSTLRVEEIPNNKDDARFEDQSSQGSIKSEISHQLPIIVKESDYFDHMYESFDADDEDFNYEDPNLTMSGWSNHFDKIESSTAEVPKKDEKSQRNFNEKDEEDPSSRLKRDSPLILFKVKGNPKKEIIIWPSNWRGLINRHLMLNRSGDATQRTTRRKSYKRLRKTDPRLVPSSFEAIRSEHLNDDH